MIGPILIDTNLLVLLIVGSVSCDLIARNSRLGDYDADNFVQLTEVIGMFSDIVTVPHVLAEVSTFVRRTKAPYRGRIHAKFHDFINRGTIEYPVFSIEACRRPEFPRLGLTDAVLLHVCEQDLGGSPATLLTVDEDLANCASSLGYGVIDFKREYMDT